ncbi:VC0807 family protein [Curtobacterium sp. S6]|uniref:VC0807 family protein n=1 Tax=Curtobacterium sp. S6 TaxID=1479623 RepID=UPI001364AD10|nr:VC0807 family protein [Curtobacterium sp. S6]
MSATGNQAVMPRRRLIVQLVVDVVLPLVVFYAMRSQGASVLMASVVSGAIPAARSIFSLVRGRVDVMSLVVLSLFVVGTVIAYLEGDARLFFAKDGWLTGMLGLWIIFSLWMARPFMLHLGRAIALAKKGNRSADEWEHRWHADLRFRHDLRFVSCVVGAVLMLDAVVRVFIAYTLPVDVVPAATNIQYVIMLVGLLGWFFPYTARHGLRA